VRRVGCEACAVMLREWSYCPMCPWYRVYMTNIEHKSLPTPPYYIKLCACVVCVYIYTHIHSHPPTSHPATDIRTHTLNMLTTIHTIL
jgi:hypothetical protein